MFNLPSIQMQRSAWTLNDIVNGRLKATHICYVMQYGSIPTYGITNLETGKTSKFKGSVELIRKLYSKKVLVKVLLSVSTNGYQEDLDSKDKAKFVDEQVDGEVKLVEPVIKTGSINNSKLSPITFV